MRDHTKLRAFELADEVAMLTYKSTAEFPKNEQFGLTSQMRRAAVSVPSNIVEGCTRESSAWKWQPKREPARQPKRELWQSEREPLRAS